MQIWPISKSFNFSTLFLDFSVSENFKHCQLCIRQNQLKAVLILNLHPLTQYYLLKMMNAQYKQSQEQSLYSDSYVEPFNLQQNYVFDVTVNQKMGQTHVKMLMSKQYEQNLFPSLANTENYNYRTDSNQYFSLCENEEEKKGHEKDVESKGPPVTKIRTVNKIVTSINNKKKWNRCLKGNRFETRNICKHLFKETTKYLKMIVSVNELSCQQKERVKSFFEKKGKINLDCFAELFQCRELRLKCLSFYESIDLVSNVMKSKADVKSKLTFLKYLQKIRSLPLSKNIKCWKK